MNKPDCYKCKWRETVPGSAHSCCKHPSLKEITKNPMIQLMGTFASVGRVDPLAVSSKKLNTKLDPVGVKNGWANFPVNFDPIWVLNCDGFKAKEKKKRRSNETGTKTNKQ